MIYNCGESELPKRLLQYIDACLSLRGGGIDDEAIHSGLLRPRRLGARNDKKRNRSPAEFNEQQVVKDITRRLMKNDGCLITDAGTPGISDPGFRLVRECVKNNTQVVPIPGANAAIAALSASGLPTDKFMFLGFLQKTANKTVEALQATAMRKPRQFFMNHRNAS